MRVRLLRYGPSTSARLLSEAMGIRMLRLSNSRFRPTSRDLVLNWGAHNMPFAGCAWLNHPEYVKDARDKVRTFAVLSSNGVPTVEWTTNWQAADTWLHGGDTVFIRTSTTGQGGSGIIVVQPPAPPGRIREAPLYTKRFVAEHEYRVHVVGEETYVTKKRRRNGAERSLVRNYTNGYVFCTNNVHPPEAVRTTGKAAVAALGLDFGAVDLLCTNNNECRVLEVNSAPGIEGSTLVWYAEQMNNLIERRV